MTDEKPKIAFIGGGNMARSIVGGLVCDQDGADRIWISDPSPDQLSTLSAQFPGVHTTGDNNEAVQSADLVVFAVKPQVMREVALDLQPAVQSRRPLIVSIAAGIRTRDLDRWLGDGLPIVRCMPNTPALVRSGATGLYANAAVNASQRDQAEAVMRAVGLTLWFDDENSLDAVTALSGSGPAYFFLVMEAMEQAGIQLGLSAEAARLLTLETAFGAAKLALESEDGAATLRQRVTSKGGTTERALTVLEEGGLQDLFERALRAAAQRASELAEQLGEES